jgi:hypothetical protein
MLVIELDCGHPEHTKNMGCKHLWKAEGRETVSFVRYIKYLGKGIDKERGNDELTEQTMET